MLSLRLQTPLRRVASFALACVFAAGCHKSSSDGDLGPSTLAMVRHWNKVSVDASGLDHMPSNQGPPHTFGQQVGPCRSARAMAIVHIAVFEAMNAIKPTYTSYIGLAPASPSASIRAAIAQAAHDTLVALYPSQASIIDDYLADDLALIGASTAKTNGIAVGAAAAAGILALRTGDGSNHSEPLYGIDYIPSNAPGVWRQDPITLHPLALGANWSTVTPFVMTSADQFRVDPPPALTSAEYQFAYEEVKVLGGDGVITPTARDEDGTQMGIYWAYDGMPSLCAPPRLYNQIALQIADEQNTSAFETAHLLALANVAMADVGIAIWESKYFYAFWRPVAGIREADPGTGPTGAGDGNPGTIGDATYTPLGAPASNAVGPNFTPPFPAYPSGHAGFGGALFQTLRRFYGTDDIAFTFVSDEYNGVTLDNQGNLRPMLPRSFDNFSEPEEENGQSRIYLGIHWRFDKTEGIAQGREVANEIYDNIFAPLP